MIEKRRFPRIVLKSLPEPLQEISGAAVVTVTYEGYQSSDSLVVFDLSYGGAAFETPEGFAAKSGKEVGLRFEFFGQSEMSTQGEIIRVTDKIVAVQFRPLSPENRLVLDAFLKEEIIGLNTYLIQPKFYAATADFDLWFHGPGQTNIILWREGAQQELNKALFEIDSWALLYEKENGQDSWSMVKDKSDPVFNEYDIHVDDSKAMEELDPTIVKRALDILSQVKDEKGELLGLSKKMAGKLAQLVAKGA